MIQKIRPLIFQRRPFRDFFELAVKIRKGLKTAFVTGARNVGFFVDQEFTGMADADFAYKIGKGLVGMYFKITAERSKDGWI